MSEGRARTARSSLPWLATLALLVTLCALVVSGWRSDMAHDEGPLSLHRAFRVTLPVRDPADAATLARCFERADPALWYRIARDPSSTTAAAACYHKPDGSGVSARVLDGQGRRVGEVAVLREAGAWRWADPMVDLRWAALMAAFGFVILAVIHAHVVPRAESAVPSAGFTRVLVCTPVFGLMWLPWLQGLTRARRRTLLLRHLVLYPSVFSYGVLGAGLEASATTADVFVAILPGTIGIVALRARRGSWPRWRTAWEAVVRAGRCLRDSRRSRIVERLRPAAAFLGALATMFVDWVDARRGVPPAPTAPRVVRGASPRGDVVEVDLSRLGAASQSVHRLVLGLKLGAVFLSAWFLFPGGDDTRLALSWQRITTATVAFIALEAVVIGVQEHRLHLVAGYALLWAAFGSAALLGLGIGAISISDAIIVAWVGLYLLLAMLWWRRRSRRLGVSTRDVQAVLRVGDLPRGSRLRIVLSPLIVVRLLVATPLLVMGVVLSTASVVAPPVVGDAALALSGRVHGFGRRVAGPALRAFLPRERTLALCYVEPASPGMWTIPVRGNLMKYGSWGPQLVAFDEFVRDRLGAEGVSAAEGPVPWEQVMVAVPVGPPLPESELARVDPAFGASSYLAVFVPAGAPVLETGWLALQEHLHAARDIGALRLDGRVLAALLPATGPPVVYVGSRADEWHYMSALHRAVVTARGPGTPPVERAPRL